DRVGHGVDASDRGDIADKIVVELLIERGVDHVVRTDGEQRVAIRRRSHHGLGCYIAAAARAVLDDELLTEPLGQRLSHDTRDDIDRLTGGKTDHHAHRTRGIGLRACDPRYVRQRGSSRCQLQKLPARKFHGALDFLSLDLIAAVAAMKLLQNAISTRKSRRRPRSPGPSWYRGYRPAHYRNARISARAGRGRCFRPTR